LGAIYIGIFATQNTAKGNLILRPISRVYGKGGVPIKSGVEPDQEDYIQDKPADHGDDVVAGRAGLGKRDVAADCRRCSAMRSNTA